jgi:hypothetical protein
MDALQVHTFPTRQAAESVSRCLYIADEDGKQGADADKWQAPPRSKMERRCGLRQVPFPRRSHVGRGAGVLGC